MNDLGIILCLWLLFLNGIIQLSLNKGKLAKLDERLAALEAKTK
jgi:hypothetical protein